jgi:hypothetical protein
MFGITPLLFRKFGATRKLLIYFLFITIYARDTPFELGCTSHMKSILSCFCKFDRNTDFNTT